jgi:hypothetical protein
MGLIEPASDDEAQHPVTEKLEPLVTVAAGAGMGEGPLEKRLVPRPMS